jgi:hypothetical protein
MKRICPNKVERVKRICLFCGKEFEIKITRLKFGKGKFCCPEHFYLWNRGANHSGWAGGVKGHKPYTHEFSEEFKEKVKDRDNYTCQKCGITEAEHKEKYGYGLSIHHINYNKKETTFENTLTACNRCNTSMNSHRKFWQEYWQAVMKARLQGQKEGFALGYIKGRIDQKQLDLWIKL